MIFSGTISLYAQMSSLHIEGQPEKSSDELVGVKDINDRFCAAVQVISDMEGFKYDSYNGVVRVDDNPGEDMVYLQPDERVLKIFLADYEPLKIILSEIGIQLKSKDVWKIRITGEKILTEIPVTIISNPEGANIYLDDKFLGTGQSFKVATGEHSLRIEKDGFRTISETIIISDSTAFFKYTLRKIEQQLVTIKSNPPEAQIFIDDIDVGRTNKGIFRYPGSYRLRLTKSKYETVEETITIIESGDNIFEYSLIKTTAILTIITDPIDADVSVNNEKTLSKTIELSPGKHEIETKKEGYFTETRTVDIEKGKDITETFTLAQKTGNLQLVVEPMETNVVLKRNDSEIDSWTGSKLIKGLPVGEYEIACSISGYKDNKKVCQIELDKVTELNITMEKGSSQQTERLENFVFVEGGTFQMGSNDGDSDEKPVHSVTVSSFYVGKFEVTQKEYQNVMGKNPSYFKGENNPVENVTWYDAVKYCNKRSEKEGRTPSYNINGNNVTCDFSANGYRLPTEAEWEYAARGGNKSQNYKYSGSNKIGDVAWYDSNSGLRTHPVGQKAPNELGIYDMTGNVWEWCWDWYDGNYLK